jgi:hypothetical protein
MEIESSSCASSRVIWRPSIFDELASNFSEIRLLGWGRGAIHRQPSGGAGGWADAVPMDSEVGGQWRQRQGQEANTEELRQDASSPVSEGLGRAWVAGSGVATRGGRSCVTQLHQLNYSDLHA